jgi:outer membrane protein assembly factor BamB
MYARLTLLSIALTAFSGCAAHFASRELGMAHSSDPHVVVFRSDRETSWRQFRLGDGLNVVVADPKIPREFAWRVATGGISSSPTVMGSTLLVSCNDHHLYAIDLATGAVRWRYHAENEVMSQPAYANGLVYVGIGNNAPTVIDVPYFEVAGSGMNKLEAIDASDGIEQWWSGLAGTGMPSQAIVYDEVVAVDGAGTVLAVDPRTGAYRWHDRLPSVFAMSSVVADKEGRIYLSGNDLDAVYALRSRDGALLWTHHFNPDDGSIGDDPLASSGSVLVGMYLEPLAPGPYGAPVTMGSRVSEHMYALDKRTGRLVWDSPLPGVRGTVGRTNESAIALIYGGHVFVGSAFSPIVTALDMRGRITWQRRVSGVVGGGIAALDGVLYFGDSAGHLWALDARSGHPIGSLATDMRFYVGSPIIVNDTLVMGGHSDTIAVPLADIRGSQQVSGVTRLSVWERLGRFFSGLIPERDPHREAAYYRR